MALGYGVFYCFISRQFVYFKGPLACDAQVVGGVVIFDNKRRSLRA
jgi:hypothetical protein